MRKIGLFVFISGVILFLAIIFIQSNLIESFKSFNKITLTQTQLEFMDSIALFSFMLYITSISLIGIGIVTILNNWTRDTYFLYPISKLQKYYYILKSEVFLICNNSFSRNILIISFFIYLLLSLFLNNTIVYNPEISFFSTDKIYSSSAIYILGCCGNPGTFPVVILHLTDHLGFVLIPINLIMPMLFSILVALTMGVIVLIAKNNKEKLTKMGYCNNNNRPKLLTGFGIFSGFFISCSTCTVNILFLSLFGTGGALAMSVSPFLVSIYQPVIAGLSFAFMLGVNLFLMKRYLYNIEDVRK